MLKPTTTSAAAALAAAAHPLSSERDVQPIIAEIGGASLVLIGEATHGTHDFYALRAAITRGLIEQRGFSAVAIEGDWPDAYRVNRFVQRTEPAAAASAGAALGGFERFPAWMWRNTAVAEFVGWLRQHNARLPPEQRAGFYGLDLYSLHASMHAVISYLEARDPAAAKEARASYRCFEPFCRDTDQYGWSTARAGSETCAEAVARELTALRGRRAQFLRHDGSAAADEFFYAVQNARLAHNAERYYRTMFRGRAESWNIRDEHMAETLEELLIHLRGRGQPAKAVVWAHNSHVGDARATDMGASGELTLGQLVRERHGRDAALIGLTTFSGSVVAAADWGEPGRVRQVRPAASGSWERLFHEAGPPRFFLPLQPGTAVHAALSQRRLERAIGVIYRPETERLSHCFEAQLAQQFDAIVHLDETRAVEPLDATAAWEPREAPETFPSGV